MVDFDGNTYDPEMDHIRLSFQLAAVRKLMSDGNWRTLDEIAATITGSVRSISARLRDLQKEKFGGHIVERRHCNSFGLYGYLFDRQ